tara:strand:+ start:412020 stop:412862 length:843 start_codon:yes stop_codon:yes gene_type:complete
MVTVPVASPTATASSTAPQSFNHGSSSRKSSRNLLTAILTSVVLHGGLLSACVLLSPNVFPAAHVRRGDASHRLELTMTMAAIDQPMPIVVAFEPASIGESDLDRIADPQTAHRGIERRRKVKSPVSLPMPQSPQARDFQPQTPDVLARTKLLDELRPRTLDAQRRPRMPVQPLPAPVSPPPATVVGTESWTPEPLASNQPPDYPAKAISQRVEGTARLRVTVNREGAVAAVQIASSSGSVMLDQAAVDAVQGWRFRPMKSILARNSQTIVIPIVFQLNR